MDRAISEQEVEASLPVASAVQDEAVLIGVQEAMVAHMEADLEYRQSLDPACVDDLDDWVDDGLMEHPAPMGEDLAPMGDPGARELAEAVRRALEATKDMVIWLTNHCESASPQSAAPSTPASASGSMGPMQISPAIDGQPVQARASDMWLYERSPSHLESPSRYSAWLAFTDLRDHFHSQPSAAGA